jgi:hypothetical protein
MFGWLVADGGCWFVLREEYCWLVAGLFWEKSTAGWWLISQANRLLARSDVFDSTTLQTNVRHTNTCIKN